MMKTRLLATIFAGLIVFTLLPSHQLHAEQPQMNEAIEQLELARKSEHPLEHLKKAKHHLEEAKHDKHGERVKALHQVDEAIEAARKGEHKRMEEHITRAIRETREGKHEAGRRK
jgi:hypothetical protein